MVWLKPNRRVGYVTDFGLSKHLKCSGTGLGALEMAAKYRLAMRSIYVGHIPKKGYKRKERKSPKETSLILKQKTNCCESG